MLSLISHQTTSADEDVEKREPYCTVGWECRVGQPLWKTVWDSLKILKMELLFDPVIPVLGVYSKNPDTPTQKNLCTPMFIAVLVTIAKYWKQPKCPAADEWIKKLWYITQWNTMQQKERRRNSYPLQWYGWNWRLLC